MPLDACSMYTIGINFAPPPPRFFICKITTNNFFVGMIRYIIKKVNVFFRCQIHVNFDIILDTYVAHFRTSVIILVFTHLQIPIQKSFENTIVPPKNMSNEMEKQCNNHTTYPNNISIPLLFFRTTTPLQRPTDVFKAKCLTNCAIICKNITTTVSASIWDLKNCAGVKQSLQIYLVYGTYLFSKSSELKIQTLCGFQSGIISFLPFFM